MIVVRDVFQLKFGQAKGAVDLWKQVIAINQKMGYGSMQPRILTDMVGSPYYTLVLESTFESMAQFEEGIKKVLANPEWASDLQQDRANDGIRPAGNSVGGGVDRGGRAHILGLLAGYWH